LPLPLENKGLAGHGGREMKFQSCRNSANTYHHLLYALLLSAPLLFVSACGGGRAGGGGSIPPTITSISVSCTPASVEAGQTSQCSAAVSGTGSYSSAVTWSAVSGAISSSGLYTAPASVPAAGSDTITATSTQDSTKTGSAKVTVTAVPATITSVSSTCTPSAVLAGQTSQCSSTVDGTGSYSSAVNWAVNNVASGNGTVGTISNTGVYLAPTTVPSAGSVTVSAISQSDNTKSGSFVLSLAYPAPTVASVSPVSAALNSAATPITVSGSGFVPASSIYINGSTISTGYISSTSLSGQIPATAETSAGTLAITVVNPTPGGGTSNSVNFDVVAGTMTISVVDLPSGANAAITVSGPGGYSAQVTATQTLQNLALGTYTISAATVHFGSNTYTPTAPSITVNIPDGTPVSSTVDYYNIMPDTTKVLDSTGLSSLRLGADNSTLIISGQSTVAGSLNPGDVLIVNNCTALPNGKVFKVNSVDLSAGWYIVQTSPATLMDAYQQYKASATEQIDANAIAGITAVAKGVRVYRRPARNNSQTEGNALTDPCSGQSNLFFQPVDVSLDPGSNTVPSVSLSGTFEFCPTVDSSVDWSIGVINGAHFEVDLGESADITTSLSTSLSSFDGKILLFTAPLPNAASLAITPVLNFYAGVKGSAAVGLTSEASQSASLSVGFDWANGNLTPIQSFSNQVAQAHPPQIQGAATIQGYLSAEVDADLALGVLDPYAAVVPYVGADADTTANPWWNVDWGIDGEVGVKGTIASIFKDPSLDFSILGPFTLLSAPGPFNATPATITGIVPAAPISAAAAQPIAFTGSALGNVLSVDLCSGGTCTTYTPTAVSPSEVDLNALLAPGNWHVQATDTSGNSNIFPFVVYPAPSTVTIGGISSGAPQTSTAPQQITFTGSGFQSGATITLCFSQLCLMPVNAQVSADDSATVTATLDHSGLWTAQLINPDGSQSAEFSFNVAGPLSATVAPTGGLVGATDFMATGSGATPNKAVDVTITPPAGSPFVTSVPANGQGQFSYGPFAEANEGAYTILFTDATSGMSSPELNIVVSAGIHAQVAPASGTVNSTSFNVTGWGATAGVTVRSTLVLPDKSVQNTTTAASGSGTFSFAYTATEAGTYSAVYTDTSTSAMSTPVNWTAGAGASIQAAVNPSSGVINTTTFTITGQGATSNGGVTAHVYFPDGTSRVFHAQATGTTFAFAGMMETTAGNYAAAVIDDTTGSQSALVSWTANPDANTTLQSITVTPSAWNPVFAPGATAVSVMPLVIAGSAGANMKGTIVSNQPWLLVDGHASENWAAPETIALNVNPTGLPTGSNSATLTITSSGATNSPVVVDVTALVRTALQVTTTSVPDVLGGVSYQFPLSATGGTGSGYKWSLAGGYLPYGLSLDPQTGVISGNPASISSTQSIPFSVQVEDSSGADATANLTVTYRPGLFVLDYSPSNFQFTVGTQYTAGNSITIPTSGGVAPITLAAVGMPPGLSLNSSSGLITGTPTKPGNYSVIFNATDTKGDSGTATFVLPVVLSPLTITTATLPSGQVGVAYQQYISGSGGSQTGFTWTIAGTLPAGLQATPNTGCTECALSIAGTPTTAGTYNLTVTLADSLGDKTSEPLTLTIASAAPPQIPAAVLPLATIGTSFSYQFSVTGGTGPYTWAFNGNSPDPGLVLSTAGVLSGVPTVASACQSGPSSSWYGSISADNFQVKVTDANNQSAIQQFCMGTFYPTPTVTSITPSPVTADGASHVLTITGTNFRKDSYVIATGSGSLLTAYVDQNHVTVTLTPSPNALFAISGQSTTLYYFDAGSFPAWVVQPAANLGNQNVSFTIADPAPTITSVSAVLNNSTSQCTANLLCQIVINGTGLVFDSQYQILETGTSLQRATWPNTSLPWTTVTTTSFSLPAGTHTVVVTNPNQAAGGPAAVQAQFTVTP